MLIKLAILTNFIPKGKEGKNKEDLKILYKELNKERSTRLKGSYGTEKNIMETKGKKQKQKKRKHIKYL